MASVGNLIVDLETETINLSCYVYHFMFYRNTPIVSSTLRAAISPSQRLYHMVQDSVSSFIYHTKVIEERKFCLQLSFSIQFLCF